MDDRAAGLQLNLRTMFALWIGLTAIVLGGCALNRTFIPEVHKVQPGESLSSIAAEYGLNWHKLARWNHIAPPYNIYVGQRLSLDPFPPLNYAKMQRQRLAAQAARHPTPRSTVTAAPANPGPSVTSLSTQQPSGRTTAKAAPAGGESATRPAPAAPSASPTAPAPVDASGNEPDHAAAAPPLVNEDGWRWPLAASVLDNHGSETARHGINLYGVAGTPVYAAHSGQVVYSGVGLLGYGKLVIIKQDDNYLSAYGYVRKVQVEEGDRVEAGQEIAQMGLGPGTRAMLHFEVRHDGKSISPKTVLPQR